MNGKEVSYSVKEDQVDGYEIGEVEKKSSYEFTVTNTLLLTEATVKKVWNDADNQDGLRPEKLEVTLSNGTKVVLNEENSWTFTVKDLPVYLKGNKIEYTWTEAELPEGYELTSTTVDGTITTLTNTHNPYTINLQVVKEWDDENNERGIRPTEITFVLLANGKFYEEVTLTEEVNWSHSFSELPAYDDGEKIEYTVVEENVPAEYEVAYEGSMEDGTITIHNMLGQGDGEPDDPPHNNPQTGDNVVIYMILFLISMIGFVSGKIYLRKYDI